MSQKWRGNRSGKGNPNLTPSAWLRQSTASMKSLSSMALAPRSKSSYARSRVCGSSSASPGAAASAGPGFGISGAWGCSSSSGVPMFSDEEAMGSVLRAVAGFPF